MEPLGNSPMPTLVRMTEVEINRWIFIQGAGSIDNLYTVLLGNALHNLVILGIFIYGQAAREVHLRWSWPQQEIAFESFGSAALLLIGFGEMTTGYV